MNVLVQRLPVLLTRLRRALMRVVSGVVLVAGITTTAMVVLAFTSLPWRWHRVLGTAAGECITTPASIVVLGGSGMPSGPEVLRLYHAAEWANAHPEALVVVVHPPDTAVMDAMLAELRLRGVGEARLRPLLEGTNTREQSLALFRTMPHLADHPMALVTAPENTYRSVRAFRKAGFAQVCGAPAWDTPMFIDLDYDHRAVGGRRHVPDVSGYHALRYDLWNRLKLQLSCLRESVAIAYYAWNGWI